jgi:hypothetical protein
VPSYCAFADITLVAAAQREFGLTHSYKKYYLGGSF